MNDKPIFHPERDRAIRQMLAEVSRTEPTRRPRRRQASVFLGLIVAALLVSSGGVAMALTGVIRIPSAALVVASTQPPAATPAITPTQQTEPDPIGTLIPEPTMDPSDPTTWVIDFTGIGPITFGDSKQTAEEAIADTPYSLSPGNQEGCAATFYNAGEDIGELMVSPETYTGETVGYISVAASEPDGASYTGPRTAADIGPGSTMTELMDAYPDATRTGGYGASDDYYAINNGEGIWIIFAVATDTGTVYAVTVAGHPTPPREYC